jgi:PKD repeat protein
MKKFILGLMVVLSIGASGGAVHAWGSCSQYSGAMREQCEDDKNGRNFVEELTVNVADAVREVELFNLRMQYYLRPYAEEDLSFRQWKELYGYSTQGAGPIPTGDFSLPDASSFGQIGANTDLRAFILNVLNWVLSFLGLVAIAVIIFAGYLYVVGGEENAEKSKKMILYSAIGIIVILSSYALVNTIITKTLEGGDNAQAAYVAVDDVVTDIHIQVECVDSDSDCVVYSLGSSGGWIVPEYHDVVFTLTGPALANGIKDIQWNFNDGGLYPGDENVNNDGRVGRSFVDSKWYSVAVMGQVAKENPNSEDDNPWNEFVGQMRLWVGDIAMAQFSMSPSVNPKIEQSVKFDASNSATVAGGIYDYVWTCAPAVGVPSTICADFEAQRMATDSKQKQEFYATFNEPGAVTIGLQVKVKVGSGNPIISPKKESVLNIQLGSGPGGPTPNGVDFTVPNRIMQNTPVELKAKGGPADGTYEWTFADATTDSGDRIMHTFTEAGVEEVQLIAKDAEGNQIGGMVSKNVIVISPNVPTAIAKLDGEPIISGSLIEIDRNDMVTFTAESCDISGDCGSQADVSEIWKKNGNVISIEQLNERISKQLEITGISLTATSTTDPSKESTTAFRVKVNNNLPAVEFYVKEEDSLGNGIVRFNVTADDSDGEIVQYMLEASEYGQKLESQTIPTTQGELSTVMDLSAHAGTRDITFKVTVKDDDGGARSVTKNKTMTIEEEEIINQAPNVSIFSNPGTTGTQDRIFRFFTQAVDPDRDHLTYEWTFPDGTQSVGRSAYHRFSKVGEHKVVVEVSDGIETVEATETINVIDPTGNGTNPGPGQEEPSASPQAVITEINPLTGPQNKPFWFLGAGYDSDGDTLTYEWSFGDGETSSQKITNHVYAEKGTYEVKLTVSDGDTEDIQTAEVTVLEVNGEAPQIGTDPENIPPQAVITGIGPKDEGPTGQPFTFLGTGYDLDGDDLTYEWDFGDDVRSPSRNAMHVYAEAGTYEVKLTVSDAEESATVTRQIEIYEPEDEPENPQGDAPSQPPQVSIQGIHPRTSGLVGSAFTFYGRGTDLNGDVLTYSWDFDDNTDSVEEIDAVHTFTQAGKYNVTLTGSDGESTGTASVEIEIYEKPEEIEQPPVASISGIGPQTINHVYKNFHFQGHGYDPNGDVLTYEWNFGDNTALANTKNASHAYTTPGTYTVTFTVSDGTSSDSIEATVEVREAGASLEPNNVATPYAPTVGIANIAPKAMGKINEIFTFYGSAYDLNGDELTYEWDFKDGTTANTEVATHAFKTAGTYEVAFRASDGTHEEEATIIIKVYEHPVTVTQPPVANIAGIGPQTINHVNKNFHFQGNGYDPDQDELTYSWNFGDDTPPVNTQNTSHSYSTPGTYSITFTVSDGESEDIAMAEVEVREVGASLEPNNIATPYPPSAGISGIAPSTEGEVGDEFTFYATGYDLNGDALSYSWDFKDGTTFDSQVAKHSFDESGVYDVLLTVSDGTEEDNVSVTITVYAEGEAPSTTGGGGVVPPQPPLAGIVGVYPGEVVEYQTPMVFYGAGSDPNGNPVTYSWDFGDNTVVSTKDALHTYETAGTHDVTFEVSDGTDTTAVTASVQMLEEGDTFISPTPIIPDPGMIVSPASPTAPQVAIVGVYPDVIGRIGSPLAFYGALHDPNGDSLTFEWDFGDGEIVESKSTTHTFTAAGTYTVKFRANDGMEEAEVSVEITILEAGALLPGNNGPLDPNAGVVVSPLLPDAPQAAIVGMFPGNTGDTTTQFKFYGAGSDPNGDSLEYEWDFGDESTVFMKNAIHTFTTPGVYLVKFKVHDGEHEAEVSISVQVVEEGQPIPPSVIPPYTPVYTTDPIVNMGNGGTLNPENLEDLGNAIEALEAELQAALIACASPTECEEAQELINIMNEVQEQLALLEQTTDPAEREQIKSAIEALLNQAHAIDENINLAPYVIPDTFIPGNVQQENLEELGTELEMLEAELQETLANCSTPAECKDAKELVGIMDEVQLKLAQLAQTNDPVARAQLKAEISALLNEAHEIDSNINLGKYVVPDTILAQDGSVLIVSGGAEQVADIQNEIENALVRKRKALLQCASTEACQKLQEEIKQLELIQQKMAALDAEKDPEKRKLLTAELEGLFGEMKAMDPTIDLTLATIRGTQDTVFFLYGQVRFKTDRPLAIEWDTGDGRYFAGQDVSWNYAKAGLYTVKMTVSDGTAAIADILTIKID